MSRYSSLLPTLSFSASLPPSLLPPPPFPPPPPPLPPSLPHSLAPLRVAHLFSLPRHALELERSLFRGVSGGRASSLQHLAVAGGCDQPAAEHPTLLSQLFVQQKLTEATWPTPASEWSVTCHGSSFLSVFLHEQPHCPHTHTHTHTHTQDHARSYSGLEAPQESSLQRGNADYLTCHTPSFSPSRPTD